MNLSNSNHKTEQAIDLATHMLNSWRQYSLALYQYMVSVKEPNTELKHLQTIYNSWTALSALWKEYTDTIRAFSNHLTWDTAIEVSYGDIVGFALPNVGQVVYLNAFTGRDDETALCRYANKNLMMRVGSLPIGTYVFTPRQTYVITVDGLMNAYPVTEVT